MSKKKQRKTKSSINAIIQDSSKYLGEQLHTPGAPRCLIIDGMHLAYRMAHVHKRFSYKGRSTSMMYGVPNLIKSMVMQDKPAKVIVCWDGLKHPERLTLLPTYKSHRDKDRDPVEHAKFHKQIRRLRKLLYAMGIPQAHNPDMEGDDMVYWMTLEEVDGYPITIYSGDKDFAQLISKDISLQKPSEKYANSWHTFFLDFKVQVHQYIDYLCLVGDTSDDIPGYRGIGPVRASQFLQKHGSIKEYLHDEDAEFSGMVDKDALRDIWKRNRILIGLRNFNRKHHTRDDIKYYKGRRFPEFNNTLFTQICAKYGLKTFMTDTFKKHFIELCQK